MCSATSIFDPKKVKDDTQYGMNEVAKLASLHSSLTLSDLQDEWKTFHNYMKVQSTKQECPTAKVVMQKLASQGDDLADTFPCLSKVSKIILVCPLGTASVERSFSTMGRICNKLRQRMLPENLAYCMRISIERPNTLTLEQSQDIVRLITYIILIHFTFPLYQNNFPPKVKFLDKTLGLSHSVGSDRSERDDFWW